MKAKKVVQPNFFQQDFIEVSDVCSAISQRTTVLKIEKTAKNIPRGFGGIVAKTVGEIFCADMSCPVHGDAVLQMIEHTARNKGLKNRLNRRF